SGGASIPWSGRPPRWGCLRECGSGPARRCSSSRPSRPSFKRRQPKRPDGNFARESRAMMPSPRLRTLRAAAILFFAWLAFYLLQAVISMALPPRSALAPRDWLAIDVTIAALWTGLSAVIARWHAKVRAFAPSFFIIVAAHVPLFVVAAVLDAWLARVVIHALNPSTVVIPFWGTVSYYADFDLVSYVAVVAISETLTMRRAAAARERRERRLATDMGSKRVHLRE